MDSTVAKVCIKPFSGYKCLQFNELQVDNAEMTPSNSIDVNVAALEGDINVQIILPPLTATSQYGGFGWRRRVLLAT